MSEKKEAQGQAQNPDRMGSGVIENPTGSANLAGRPGKGGGQDGRREGLAPPALAVCGEER